MVKVKWWGQACVELTNDRTVVIDPHDGKGIGLKPPKTKADIVLISHSHYDHADGLPLVSAPSTIVVREAGRKEVLGIKILAIDSYHDNESGRLRGKNLIFLCEMEGLRICHLGDLGHIPFEAQLKHMKDVDLLLIPVGGTYTLDAREASRTVENVKPKITIPIHYKIPGLQVDISGVEEFLEGKKGVRKIGRNEVIISRKDIPPTPEIWVLSPP